MKRKLYQILLLLCTIATQPLFAAAPTNPATNVSFSSIDGGAMRISWTSGNGARRIIVAALGSPVTAVPVNGVDYLSDDDFGLGQEIAPGQFVVFDGTGTFADLRGFQPAATYHFTIFEYNGSNASTEYLLTGGSGSASTLSAPVTQPSALAFTNMTGNAMKISWTAGSGARRLVLMRKGSPVNANPADLTYYNSNSTFGSGAEIGTGNFVVLSGTGNTVSVTNLEPNTTYHVALFEYNGNATPVYLTVNPLTGSQATLPRPSVASTNISFTSIEGNAFRMDWTAGNGSRRIVVARQGQPVDVAPADGIDYYTGSGTSISFATAPEIAAGQKVVYDGTGSASDLSGLLAGTTYHFRIFEYDGAGSAIAYKTDEFPSASRSTAVAPTTQASDITFSDITGNSMKVSWTNGNGTRRILLAKAGAPVDAQPADLQYYSSHSTLGSGAQIGTGNYVVASGNSTSATIYGLSTNVTHHFALFEYNGNNAPVYLLAMPARGSAATSDRPTLAASNMSFTSIEGNEMRVNWTSGNGQKRIVVVREGAPVDAVPVDGVDYLAASNASFTAAPEIAPGQKVVYDNAGNFTDLTGLVKGTTYHYRVYEYSGSGAAITYLTASFAQGSKSTLTAPTAPATNLHFTNITGNAITVNYTAGNGNRRIVIAREGAPVNAIPVDYINYSYSSTFGNGAQIGPGNYVVSNSNSGTSVTVTNLSLNTTYYFAVYEANGTSGPVFYTFDPAAGSQATADRPTVAPSNLSFSQVEGNEMRVSFTAGNGQRRIVIAREGAPVDAVPVDGVDYLAASSASFTAAPEIAPGQKVVYDNAGTFTDLTGLQPNKTYHFRVYEYSVGTNGIAYLAAAYGSGSKSTISGPTVQASNVSFTSVGSTSMIVSWTSGNGTNRLVVARQGGAVNRIPLDLTNYSSSNTFGNGSHLGEGNYVVAKTNASSFTLSNLVPGTTYHIAVFEYNGSSGPVFLVPGAVGQATTIGPPAMQASNAVASQFGSSTVQLGWTNGSGNRRIVLMKQGSPVDAVPANNTDYFANSFFGSGTQIGSGNFVVFDGIQNFVTVTNLQPGTPYYFSVFEYNDFGATSQVLTTTPASLLVNTLILPVQLIHFKGVAANGKVQLSWATAAEENSERFDIQRSADGSHFTTIATVAAAGNSSSRRDYGHTDQQPLSGVQYYRLKQVDRDGQTEYSSIVRVDLQKAILIEGIANPIQGHTIEITWNGQPRSSSVINLYDVQGRLVARQPAQGGKNRLDVSGLGKGLYLLEAVSGPEVQVIKLIR